MQSSARLVLMQRNALAALACCFLTGFPLPSVAQNPAPAPQIADPRQVAAQSAFEALPEAERKAIQSDLIWAADFSGAVSGGFGPLTFRALQAFERSNATQVDGILSPAERKLLATAAQKQRDAVKFTMRTDEKSQTRIGLPEAYLTRKDVNALGGSRWQSADQAVTFDTFVSSTETLEQMFERVTPPNTPARKVTYKLLRPEFFVVTGETPTGKFYRRVVKGPAGVKGFTLGYAKASAQPWDRLVIAMANAFEPFPGPSPVTPASVLATNPVVSSGPAPVRALEPRRFAKSATGLIVADGKVLTATAGLAECRGASIGGVAIANSISDAASGLSLSNVAGVKRKALTLAMSAPVSPLLTLAHGVSGDAPQGERSLLVIPATIISGAVVGAFQPGAAGAPVLDRSGRLAGMLITDPGARLQVAGTVIAARQKIADSAMIARFLGAQGVALPEGADSAPRSSGQIVSETSSGIVAIRCLP